MSSILILYILCSRGQVFHFARGTCAPLPRRVLINIKSIVLQNLKLLGKDLSVRGQTIVCSNCCENVNATLKIVAPELLNVKEVRNNHS